MEFLDEGPGFPKYRPPGEATDAFYVLQNLPPVLRTTRHRTSCPSGWKAERDALTLYEEMKPVMILLRILGVFPYSVTSTGNSKDTNRITETNLTPNYKQCKPLYPYVPRVYQLHILSTISFTIHIHVLQFIIRNITSTFISDPLICHFREIGRGGMDWIDLAQDRPVEVSCEHSNEPSGSIKCWDILERLSESRLLKKGSALSS
jgi:hypothetical protein